MIIKTRTKYRKLRLVFVFLIFGMVSAISYWYSFLRTEISCNDAYVMGNIIPVHALVPGLVTNIYADNTMFVNSNQILIKQEGHLAEESVQKSAAALAESIREVRGQLAQVNQAEAAIASLYVNRKKNSDNLQRYQRAELEGAASGQKVADTQADISVIDSEIVAAKALKQKDMALLGNTSLLNNPSVQKIKAEYIENYIINKRTNIYAPVSGFVVNRHVQVGQMLVSGQLLMNIVPLDNLWITANIKETDLKRIRTGQPVDINANIYGEEVLFHGKVQGIAPSGGSTFSLFPPENTTGNYIHIVERVPVRISLEENEIKNHPLRPGMSVTVNIDTRNTDKFETLTSTVSTKDLSYSTSIYDAELKVAESSAKKIMQKN
ncbi:putative multidrug resistance protein EmrK [mine drainage metagenome]|uniref:Putative multidrug resistance protein EmrK n=1 Tax=mine drainage metagenome TaxID=410659 RepID=A0A1J5RRK2_9ZZZZ